MTNSRTGTEQDWNTLQELARRLCGECEGCDEADCVPCAVAFARPAFILALRRR